MAYIGKQPTVGNFVILDSITATATTTFALTSASVAYAPQSANHCIVSLNGVIQAPISSFTISGTNIVFASALTTDDTIDFIQVLGDVLNIGTPSDATVGIAKLSATGTKDATTFLRGDNTFGVPSGGKVLQVVSSTKVDTFTASGFSSWNYVDVTGLSVSITPSSASNKILITGYISGGGDNAIYRLDNGSTITGYLGTQTGSYTIGFASAVSSSIYSVNGNAVINYLDSPASTSALTYKVQVTGNGTVSINRPTDSENSNNRIRTASTITVMEIAG